MMSDNFSFLRRVLIADAASCVATGLLMLLGAGFLAPLLGLPGSLLKYAGLILPPFAALVAYVATRQQLSRTMVRVIIISNVLWTADSILLLLSGWVAPTALGTTFVLAQAVVVGVFAELEYFGMRRMRALAA